MSTNPGTDSIEAMCHQCGQTFSTFLLEMADKNAKIVCPNCRGGGDCHLPKDSPGKAEIPVRKII